MKKIEKFHKEIGAQDIYHKYNNIPKEELNKTYMNGLTLIDSIAAANGILECVEGCKLLKNNEVACTDHRVYVVDIGLEEYFSEQFSNWNIINKVMLNPSRHSHRDKFAQILEYQLNICNLENNLNDIREHLTHYKIEQIDMIIMRILNISRKKVEGKKKCAIFKRKRKKESSCIIL